MRYARFFLNRLLATLRKCGDKKVIPLDADFHKDTNWFKIFLTKFKGKSFLLKKNVDIEIHLDICLSGMDAIFGSQIYHVTTPEFLKGQNIAIQEMFNILVALKTWASMWKNKNVKIHCDNLAVVSVLNNGKTRDKFLAAISRNIFMEAAHWDITLVITYVSGKVNVIANLLSRWENTKWQIEKLKA